MRKPKCLAEEEQRYLAARAKRRQRKDSSLVILVTSHGERPATDSDRSAISSGVGSRRAVNLSYGEQLQKLLNAYRFNTKGKSYGCPRKHQQT
jgi:hypothetical protein